MKLPISNLLIALFFGTALSAAQAQNVTVKEVCRESALKNLIIDLSQVEASLALSSKSLESLKTLESLKAIESLRSLESLEGLISLASLGQLTSLENLTDIPSPPLAPGTDMQTGPAKSAEPDPAAQPAFAISKVKKVERSFKVSKADKLNIENQFGKVDVQTWSKNEIAVEVTIVARAATEEKAQEILDKINIRITEDRGSNFISFVTDREPMQIRSSSEKAFEINYLVKMPKANPLKVSNKYGSVQVPDLDGPADLEVQYGKLTAGSLNNVKNRISVAYSGGECAVAYLKGGDLNIKYSQLALAGAGDIRTNTAYSKISIDKVEALTLESRYDTRFHLGSVGQISGTGSYSGIKIGSLKESATLNMKYCSGFEISNVAPSFKTVSLTGGYTGMALGFADNTAFNFEVDTHYGSLKMNQNLANFSFKEVKNTSGSYKGRYGKASPKGTVNVTSRYGSIAFQ